MKKTAEPNGNSLETAFDSKAAKLEIDNDLEKKVTSMLSSNVFIDCTHIKVRVCERLVYLEGKVRAQKERLLAEKCIIDIFGVVKVVNYLTFRREYFQQ